MLLQFFAALELVTEKPFRMIFSFEKKDKAKLTWTVMSVALPHQKTSRTKRKEKVILCPFTPAESRHVFIQNIHAADFHFWIRRYTFVSFCFLKKTKNVQKKKQGFQNKKKQLTYISKMPVKNLIKRQVVEQ